MSRRSLLIICGAAVGGAVSYSALMPSTFTSITGTDGRGSPMSSVRSVLDQATLPASLRVPTVAERLALYASAERTGDPATLESLLAAAAAQPPSRAQALEIDAYLLRLAEIDPARALDVAQALELGAGHASSVLHAWAEVDIDGALRALGAMAGNVNRRAVALSMLDVLGADLAVIERVASVLPAADKAAFFGAAFGEWAERDGYGAFNVALTLRDDALRPAVLQSVAASWARQDPRAALAQRAALELTQRVSYTQAVFDQWAITDPDALFAYIETALRGQPMPSAGLEQLAAADPERLLDIVMKQPSPLDEEQRMMAFQGIAQADPVSARAMVERMPGLDKLRFRQLAAIAYAGEDLEAAIAWLRDSNPPGANVEYAVLQVVASVDLERAIELLSDDSAEVSVYALSNTVFSLLVDDVQRAESIADALVRQNNPATLFMLSDLMSGWVRRDSEAALRWALDNAGALTDEMRSRLARPYAERNLDAALSRIDRLPRAMRADWIGHVAAVYALRDPAAAAAWITQYRGQPGYDVGVREVAGRVGRTDPRAAAELLDSTSAQR